MKKKFIIIFALFLIVLYFGYKYIYKSHRDISSENAAFTITSAMILNDYKNDEKDANAKYSDKTIVVKGKITQIDLTTKSIVIDEKLYGMLLNLDKDIKVNDSVSIKGRFLGYDELLEELKMDQITINK
jgi:hypothetical protein